MKNRFAQKWLDILCQTLPGMHSALLMVVGDTQASLRPLAKWPADFSQTSDFNPILKFTLNKNQNVCIPNVLQPDQNHYDFFGLPIFSDARLLGVLVIKCQHQTAERQQATLKNLEQSLEWWQLATLRLDQNDAFYASVVGLLVASFEQHSYREVLISLATELTRRFDCEKVAIGEYKDHHSSVVAISNNAQLEARSNLLQKIADTMDEAIEQDSIVVMPDAKPRVVQRAHQELSRKFGYGSLLTVPLLHDSVFMGAISLMRSEEQPFDTDSIRLCEQAFALIAPFLALKKAEEHSLTVKIANAWKQRLSEWLGVKHLKSKLTGFVIALLLLLGSLLRSDFNLTADAVLEGKMQRVVAAPINGFLLSASVRAGDAVKQGDMMASLDNAELQLELSKLEGQLQKARREYREALSIGDLVKVRVISAQIAQAEAEMELTRQQLQKVSLTAPFDGIVIEGDLSQKLGSPVERGETLFKLAPLEGYRIILKVDERLISYVKVGQKGSLVLTSMPSDTLQLVVQKITAVAKTDSGKNIFRVEASLENAPALLRPGMEGVGKIHAGRASLLWIWTHDSLAWLRLWFWSW